MNKKLVFFLIILIIWMTIVFLFSNQSGKESKNTSEKVIESAITIFPDNQNLSENQIEKIVKSYQKIVRKNAHLIIYTIGGTLIYACINNFNISTKKKCIYTILIGGIYAITDEVHQYFIPGRTALVKDVLIDITGVVLGVLIAIGIKKFISTRKKARNKQVNNINM